MSACWLVVESRQLGGGTAVWSSQMPKPQDNNASPSSHRPPAPGQQRRATHSSVDSTPLGSLPDLVLTLGQWVCSFIWATSPASPCMCRAAWPSTSCPGSVFHMITPRSGDVLPTCGLTKQSSLMNMHRQLSVPSKRAGRNVSRAPMLLL